MMTFQFFCANKHRREQTKKINKIKVDKQKEHMAFAQVLHAHMQRRTRTSHTGAMLKYDESGAGQNTAFIKMNK